MKPFSDYPLASHATFTDPTMAGYPWKRPIVGVGCRFGDRKGIYFFPGKAQSEVNRSWCFKSGAIHFVSGEQA